LRVKLAAVVCLFWHEGLLVICWDQPPLIPHSWGKRRRSWGTPPEPRQRSAAPLQRESESTPLFPPFLGGDGKTQRGEAHLHAPLHKRVGAHCHAPLQGTRVGRLRTSPRADEFRNPGYSRLSSHSQSMSSYSLRGGTRIGVTLILGLTRYFCRMGAPPAWYMGGVLCSTALSM
jgi:hypothetical protein